MALQFGNMDAILRNMISILREMLSLSHKTHGKFDNMAIITRAVESIFGDMDALSRNMVEKPVTWYENLMK